MRGVVQSQCVFFLFWERTFEQVGTVGELVIELE
jgi:hypothetical protein